MFTIDYIFLEKLKKNVTSKKSNWEGFLRVCMAIQKNKPIPKCVDGIMSKY